MLDKRLKACADYIKGNKVCDVGTDHAYLVAYALTTGKCSSAVACDINKGPLESAKATLIRYNAISKAELMLSDGLKSVAPDGITDIVIAGMGAELIADIIYNCKWIDNSINLILQPMTHAPYLRKWLCDNGYKIYSETAVCDNEMCYAVINAGYTAEKTNISELLMNTGFSDKSLEQSQKYIMKQYERIYKVGISLLKAGKKDLADHQLKLADEIITYLKG